MNIINTTNKRYGVKPCTPSWWRWTRSLPSPPWSVRPAAWPSLWSAGCEGRSAAGRQENTGPRPSGGRSAPGARRPGHRHTWRGFPIAELVEKTAISRTKKKTHRRQGCGSGEDSGTFSENGNNFKTATICPELSCKTFLSCWCRYNVSPFTKRLEVPYLAGQQP